MKKFFCVLLASFFPLCLWSSCVTYSFVFPEGTDSSLIQALRFRDLASPEQGLLTFSEDDGCFFSERRCRVNVCAREGVVANEGRARVILSDGGAHWCVLRLLGHLDAMGLQVHSESLDCEGFEKGWFEQVGANEYRQVLIPLKKQ